MRGLRFGPGGRGSDLLLLDLSRICFKMKSPSPPKRMSKTWRFCIVIVKQRCRSQAAGIPVLGEKEPWSTGDKKTRKVKRGFRTL